MAPRIKTTLKARNTLHSDMNPTKNKKRLVKHNTGFDLSEYTHLILNWEPETEIEVEFLKFFEVRVYRNTLGTFTAEARTGEQFVQKEIDQKFICDDFFLSRVILRLAYQVTKKIIVEWGN